MEVERKSIPLWKKLTVCYLFLFGIFQPSTFGQPTKRQDELRNQDQRDEEGYHLTPEEVEALKQNLKFDEIKRKCVNGTFLLRETLTCASCGDYCKDGEDVATCPKECEVHNLKVENQGAKRRLEGLEKQTEKPNQAGFWAVFVVLSVGALLFGTWAFREIRFLKKKIQRFEANDQQQNDKINGARPIQVQDANHREEDDGTEG